MSRCGAFRLHQCPEARTSWSTALTIEEAIDFQTLDARAVEVLVPFSSEYFLNRASHVRVMLGSRTLHAARQARLDRFGTAMLTEGIYFSGRPISWPAEFVADL
jgi:hypothetical protein